MKSKRAIAKFGIGPNRIAKKRKKKQSKQSASNLPWKEMNNLKRKVKLSKIGGRDVDISFTGGDITSDGGLALLLEAMRITKLHERFAAAFTDFRDSSKVAHTLQKLINQRVFQYAVGYEDQNDADDLRTCPGFSSLLSHEMGISREDCYAVASRMSMQRLEHAVPDGESLNGSKLSFSQEQIDKLWLEYFVESHNRDSKSAPRELTFHVDGTFAPAYGNQENAVFHGYYGHEGLYPQLIYCNGLLLSSKMRPGDAGGCEGALEELVRIIGFFRQVWPNTRYNVIGDAAYANPEIINWCDDNNVRFVFGLTGYSTLLDMVGSKAAEVEKLALASQSSLREYVEFTYQTLNGSWKHPFRIIAKVEHLCNKHGSKDNTRFIITNMNRRFGDAKFIYEEVYCPRGDSENWIREHQVDMFGKRISNHEFTANQQRMNFATLTYNLIKVLCRVGLAGTELARATWGTVRLKLLKIGGTVKMSRRRIILELASGHPYQEIFIAAAERLAGQGAQAPPR